MALFDVARSLNEQYALSIDKGGQYSMIIHSSSHHQFNEGQREVFVSIYNLNRIDRVRSLRTIKIGRLTSFGATVTRSTEVRPELMYGYFICNKCSCVQTAVEQHLQVTFPHRCKTKDCVNTLDFNTIPQRGVYVDWQRLRVQENADEIPAGNMPRCLDVICRNEMVERVKAGEKIIITGTMCVIHDTSGGSAGENTVLGKSGLGRADNFADGVQGLKKLGVREMTYRMIFVACAVESQELRWSHSGVLLPLVEDQNYRTGFKNADADVSNLTDVDKAEILQMRHTPQLYHKMMESICPSVFGHTEVKRGILLMLFGGVHKYTTEKISLRGDINVCIVGDPSCAKSQFLKFVHNFSSRSVYTSGKSSTASGLTASVVRDVDTGDFCVEAGALMLADNGICCIDEFDKVSSGVSMCYCACCDCFRLFKCFH
jgi:DNA replication licensing factor MCM6